MVWIQYNFIKVWVSATQHPTSTHIQGCCLDHIYTRLTPQFTCTPVALEVGVRGYTVSPHFSGYRRILSPVYSPKPASPTSTSTVASLDRVASSWDQLWSRHADSSNKHVGLCYTCSAGLGCLLWVTLTLTQFRIRETMKWDEWLGEEAWYKARLVITTITALGSFLKQTHEYEICFHI